MLRLIDLQAIWTCPLCFAHDAILRAYRPLFLLTYITRWTLARMLRLIGLQAIWTCPLGFVDDAILGIERPLFLLTYITRWATTLLANEVAIFGVACV